VIFFRLGEEAMDPAQYDPNTGEPYGGAGGPEPTGRQPGGPYRGYQQRPEKQDEKEQEKAQEKGGGFDEKYRRDPLGFVAWAVVVIWLGVTLLLKNLDVGVFGEGGDKNWAIFLWGAAAIFFVEIMARLIVPRWRQSLMGALVWVAVLLGVGLGLWFDEWAIIGPIVIIAVGVGILLGRLLPRR